jgi:molecular chaperone HtpG
MRAALEPHVVEVEATARLTQTPACIVAKGAVSLGMERYFASAAAQDGVPSAQHALELNPEHEVFATLRRLWENGDEDGVKRYAIVLHGQALLAEGLEIPDLPAYSKAVCELL